MAAISVATLTITKRASGEVEPDGRVVLSASEVADDWRPSPARGGQVAPVNPRSGSKPRMPRSSVRPILEEAVERGLLRAEVRGTIRHRDDGSSYRDWEWIVDPVASLAQLLDPWARWRPEEQKVRKPRTATTPCPACGEIHPIRRVDYCTGCGAQVADRLITPEPPPDDVPVNRDTPPPPASPMSEFFPDIQTAPEPPSPTPPLRTVGKIFRHRDDVPAEPDWLTDAPPPETSWLPGFDPPPIDLRTDVMVGGRR